MTNPGAAVVTPLNFPTAYKKFFTPLGVGLAGLFGGTLAAGILLGVNYARWGERRNAWLSVLIGLATFIAVLVIGNLLPAAFPSSAIAVPVALGTFQLAKQLHADRVSEHVHAGGRTASNWLAAGIGLFVLVLFVASAFGWAYLTAPREFEAGKDQIVYYSEGATKEMAASLADTLRKEGFFVSGRPVSILLTGSGETKAVTLVVDTDVVMKDAELIEAFKVLRKRMAASLGGEPLTLHLADRNLTVKQTLTGSTAQ